MLRTGPSLFAYLFMPIAVIGAIVVLALILRWSSTPSKRVVSAPAQSFGLLTTIATVATAQEAEVLAHQMRVQGIKASTARQGKQFCVLVWPAQESLARLTLARLGGGAST